MKTKAFRKIFGTFAVLAFAIGVGVAIRSVSAGTETGSGWLWGGGVTTNPVGYDGAGWASMNDTNSGSGGGTYGVNIPASGNLSGYAWNEHYGWISFNGADLAGCAPVLSQATRTGNAITGGARILSIRDAGANAGGFDGCISLSGTAPDYGVTVSGTNLSGYAWSSDLGWIDFSGASVGGATCGGQVTDTRDGQVYDTVLVGSQCWMKENMNIGTTVIASDLSNNQDGDGTGCDSTIEKYCYNNQDANCTTNHPTYPDGGLYTWDEAMQCATTEGAQGICPAGWHIPTDAEWHTLEDSLKDPGQLCDQNRSGDGCASAGTKLKPGGIAGFEGNLTGYGAFGVNAFAQRGTYGHFWTSSANGDIFFAPTRRLYNANAMVYRLSVLQTAAYSVRCIQGAGVVPPANILQLCRDGIAPVAQGGGTYGFSLPTGNTTSFTAYYDATPDCAGNDVTASTTFTEANPTGGALTLSGTNPKTFTGSSAGSESVTASYSGASITMNATVSCTETVNCSSEQASVCSGSTVPSGTTKAGTCGTVDCSNLPGTRYCDMNWKEVTPGF